MLQCCHGNKRKLIKRIQFEMKLIYTNWFFISLERFFHRTQFENLKQNHVLRVEFRSSPILARYVQSGSVWGRGLSEQQSKKNRSIKLILWTLR